MRSRALVVALAALCALAPSHPNGSVHVHGYTKKDGTHVAPYTRSAPHAKLPASPKAPRAPKPTLHAPGNPHERSKAARDAFMRGHPCPSTGKTSGACPGYVVDHVQPLKRGGADAPSNMQWQTIEQGKAKDKWE